MPTFQGTNKLTPGNVFSLADRYLNKTLKEGLFGTNEALSQNQSQDIVGRMSNMGSVNPNKGPTAKSLFYNAAFYGRDNKYGQFLFYSFSNNSNNFNEQYYQSEQTQFNSSISAIESKNPSAGAIIRASNEILAASNKNSNSNVNTGNNTKGPPGKIIGGGSAPYFWKDFLYCKYYGTIPNNYMITLRRFPAPMRDNLSLPDPVKQSDKSNKEGAGKPVAQAITWWGGKTGNTLNDLISFSTGMVWENKSQSELKEVKGFDQGFFKSVLGRFLGSAANTVGLGDLFGAGVDLTTLAVAASDGGKQQLVTDKINYALRDKMQNTPSGPLSDFIFNPVDTVSNTYIRGRGLTFSGGQMSLKFHYELTSVGQVNTKAALIDILGNLLALGTNYGNFLTPDIRYDNGFKDAIGFPGGNDGLFNFYTDPLKWTKDLIKYLADPSGTTSSNPMVQQFAKFSSDIQQKTQQLESILSQATAGDADIKSIAAEIDGPLGNILAYALSDDLIEKAVFPLSLLTGAPVGEWHLVVGNPMNPVAMIGNLICSNVEIEFSEVLGPDDFPTEIIATFTLEHGRDRERGEIESMFNRGDGRLYQSTLDTSSSTQSLDSFAQTDGRALPATKDNSTTPNPALLYSDNFNFTPEVTQNNKVLNPINL